MRQWRGEVSSRPRLRPRKACETGAAWRGGRRGRQQSGGRGGRDPGCCCRCRCRCCWGGGRAICSSRGDVGDRCRRHPAWIGSGCGGVSPDARAKTHSAGECASCCVTFHSSPASESSVVRGETGQQRPCLLRWTRATRGARAATAVGHTQSRSCPPAAVAIVRAVPPSSTLCEGSVG